MKSDWVKPVILAQNVCIVFVINMLFSICLLLVCAEYETRIEEPTNQGSVLKPCKLLSTNINTVTVYHNWVIYSEFCVVKSVTISAYKRCSVRLYLQLFVGGLVSSLRFLCLFVYSGVQHLLWLCLCFVCRRIVSPMLSIFLDIVHLWLPLLYSLTFIYYIHVVGSLLMFYRTYNMYKVLIPEMSTIKDGICQQCYIEENKVYKH